MPKPYRNLDLESLIKVMQENRVELKKTQEKVAGLEAAVHALQNDRLKSEQRREKRKPN